MNEPDARYRDGNCCGRLNVGLGMARNQLAENMGLEHCFLRKSWLRIWARKAVTELCPESGPLLRFLYKA